MKRATAFSLAASLLGVAAVAVVAEIVIALVEPSAGPDEADPWRTILHRPSPLPGLAYELTPGTSGFAQGAGIRIDERGLRVPIGKQDRRAARCRVVALGDSFTFGFGVAAEDAWPGRLEVLWSAPGERLVEVLNLGVGGYSTRDEAIVLRERALGLDPDLAIVAYVLNDPEIAPIQPLHAHFAQPPWWQRPGLARLVARGLRGASIRLRGEGDYVRALHAEGTETWRSVGDGFAAMAETARGRGVPVVVAIFPLFGGGAWSRYAYAPLHDRVARAAEAAGMTAIDLLPTFSPYPPVTLIVRAGDPHPNPRAHALAAGVLAERAAPLLPARCGVGAEAG